MCAHTHTHTHTSLDIYEVTFNHQGVSNTNIYVKVTPLMSYMIIYDPEFLAYYNVFGLLAECLS